MLRTLSRKRNEAASIQSFAELKQCSLINERARAGDQNPDFSRVIRERLPRIRKSRNEGRIFKLHISAVI